MRSLPFLPCLEKELLEPAQLHVYLSIYRSIYLSITYLSIVSINFIRNVACEAIE